MNSMGFKKFIRIFFIAENGESTSATTITQAEIEERDAELESKRSSMKEHSKKIYSRAITENGINPKQLNATLTIVGLHMEKMKQFIQKERNNFKVLEQNSTDRPLETKEIQQGKVSVLNSLRSSRVQVEPTTTHVSSVLNKKSTGWELK